MFICLNLLIGLFMKYLVIHFTISQSSLADKCGAWQENFVSI